MDSPHTAPRIALNDAEKDLLKTIYSTRIKLFSFVYLALFTWVFWSVFFTSGTKMKRMFHRTKGGNMMKYETYDYEILGHDLTDTEVFWLTRLPLGLILIGTGSYIFIKRINPYRKDFMCGEKEMVSKVITSKSYFPMTNQCFFNFDDPDYMHYEVDAEFYMSLSEGDVVAIPRAIYSKQVFEKDGRFTIM